jgi:hypothetical protein
MDAPATLREPPAIQTPALNRDDAPGVASVRLGVGGGLADGGLGGVVFAAGEGWPLRWLGVGAEVFGGGVLAHDSVSWRSFRGRLAMRIPVNRGTFRLGAAAGPALRKVSHGDHRCSDYPDQNCPGSIRRQRTIAVGLDAGWVTVTGLAELGVGGRVEAAGDSMVIVLCLTAGLDFGAR